MRCGERTSLFMKSLVWYPILLQLMPFGVFVASFGG
jgi:hypothetical protein